MGKRHNRRWKQGEPIPNPGKRAEAEAQNTQPAEEPTASTPPAPDQKPENETH